LFILLLFRYNTFFETGEAQFIRHMELGDTYMAVLNSFGEILTMGKGEVGQLGQRGVKLSQRFRRIEADKFRGGSSIRGVSPVIKIKSISAGGRHMLALDDRGKVWAWGDNSLGQLGYRTAVRSNQSFANCPHAVPLSTTAYSIKSGKDFSVVLLTGGIVCWWGTALTLRDGEELWSHMCARISTSSNSLRGLHCGDTSATVIDGEGKIYCWGLNDMGQCGIDEAFFLLKPTLLEPPSFSMKKFRVKFLHQGSAHTVCLGVNNQLYAWGRNDCGQLGVESTGLYFEVDMYGRRKRSSRPLPYVKTPMVNRMFSGSTTSTNKTNKGERNSSISLNPVPTSVFCGNRHTIVVTENDVWYMGRLGTVQMNPQFTPTQYTPKGQETNRSPHESEFMKTSRGGRTPLASSGQNEGKSTSPFTIPPFNASSSASNSSVEEDGESGTESKDDNGSSIEESQPLLCVVQAKHSPSPLPLPDKFKGVLGSSLAAFDVSSLTHSYANLTSQVLTLFLLFCISCNDFL